MQCSLQIHNLMPRLSSSIILMSFLWIAYQGQASLVHHYKLDETFQYQAVKDSVGAIDGIASELYRGETGVRGGAYIFKESDPDSINLGPGGQVLPTSSFTITFWVNFNPAGRDAGERLLDCGNSDSLGSLTEGFALYHSGNAIQFHGSDGTNSTSTAFSADNLTAGEWYLVVLRYVPDNSPGGAPDGELSIATLALGTDYTNAASVGGSTEVQAHNLGALTSNTAFLAGASPALPADTALALDGLLDDIRVYDNVLSDSEIATLYNAAIPTGGALRWLFNVTGDQEGWTGVNVTNETVAAGIYSMDLAGTDPQVISPPGLNVDLTGVDKLHVRLKNETDSTQARIFFSTSTAPGFQGHYVDVTISANDTSFQEYEVDMSSHPDWKDVLTRLRLDVPNSPGTTGSGRVSFDRIALGDSGKRPNIIFVLADDLGWKDISANGSTFYQTPNIDRLAQEGINYPNAFSANPLCSPTRAAALTGQYPGRVRYNSPNGHIAAAVLDPVVNPTANAYLPATTVGSRSRLPNGYVTYAELLKASGYATAFIGKWHLGQDQYIPDNQGFDLVIGGRKHPGPPGGYFAPFSADSNIPTQLPDGSTVQAGDHINDVLAAFAADYVEDNRNKPFLLNMWWYDVHGPFQAKPELRAKYLGQSSADGRQHSATMGAMVESLDDGMGILLDKLEQLGLAEDTIVIFTSDNGGWMYTWLAEDQALPTSNYPSRAGKATIWNGGTHVPFIVRWPGVVSPGQVSEDLVNNMDVYSTILEMAGVEPYDATVLDSQSLVPSLTGQPPLNNDTIYVQFPQAPLATASFPGAWVRQGDTKLIRFFHGNGGENNHRYELYNLADDPGETNNLANARPDLVAQLDALIEAHLLETESLVPAVNPNYVPPVFDEWTPNDGVWIQPGTNGRLKMVSNSFFPALDSPAFSGLPTPAKVRVRMQSRSFGDGRIWWQTAGDTDFNLEQSQGFPVTHDNTDRFVEIPINPGAPITRLRYQPSTDYYQTDLTSIELLDAHNNVIYFTSFSDTDGDGMSDGTEYSRGRDPDYAGDLAFEFHPIDSLDGWTSNNTSVSVTDGLISGTASSNDPQLQRTGFEFAGSEINEIRIKLRASSSGTVQFFWGHAGADNYSATRRLDLDYNHTLGWQYLHVDTVGIGAEWTDRTITRLRIDPINVSGASWDIDWIRAIDGDFDNDGIDDHTEGAFDRDTDNDGIEDFADLDSDGDGAPDAVEYFYGRDPYAPVEAGLNADADAYSDLDEMIFGTDPDSPSDSFRETVQLIQQAGMPYLQIQFSGKAGRTYRLLHKSSLNQNLWQAGTEQTLSIDETVTFIHELEGEAAFLSIEAKVRP